MASDGWNGVMANRNHSGWRWLVVWSGCMCGNGLLLLMSANGAHPQCCSLPNHPLSLVDLARLCKVGSTPPRDKLRYLSVFCWLSMLWEMNGRTDGSTAPFLECPASAAEMGCKVASPPGFPSVWQQGYTTPHRQNDVVSTIVKGLPSTTKHAAFFWCFFC